jgi:hypothetical protein
VREADTAERDRGLGGKLSLPLSLPSAKPWRTAFSISRWALTPSVLRNLRMLPLNTSSFMIASIATLYAGAAAVEPPPLRRRIARTIPHLRQCEAMTASA